PWGALMPGGEVPEDFPRFIVPAHEREMETLRQLFYLHYKGSGPAATIWDQWLPMATLWPAAAKDANAMRERWNVALSERRIDGSIFRRRRAMASKIVR